jgi:hypothetical protein
LLSLAVAVVAASELAALAVLEQAQLFLSPQAHHTL